MISRLRTAVGFAALATLPTVAVPLAAQVPGASPEARAISRPPDDRAPIVAPADRMHPKIVLRDADGVPVVRSGQPVSTSATCRTCHDVDFIQQHSTHTPRDFAPPAFSSVPRDLHVPGGERLPAADDSNCFLCHLAGPDPTERNAVHRAGWPELGPTASLTKTGVVSLDVLAGAVAGFDPRPRWDRTAFDSEGAVEAGRLRLRTPTAETCSTCHGVPASGPDEPVVLGRPGPVSELTAVRGEVYSPQRLSESGVNLVGKDALTRSWDVHAERLLDCADCHASSNNPVHRSETAPEDTPAGLVFDPRRVEVGAWLHRPSHVLAGTDTRDESGAPLSCTTCHDPEPTHAWLPYAERHGQALTCEACHTPILYAPALESVDWTRLDADGEPATTWRGCEGECSDDPARRVVGWEPALLAVTGDDGRARLAPHNLVTTWYWVDEASGEPIPITRVRVASEHATDRAAVLSALSSMGVAARMETRVEARPVHHGTTGAGFATRECTACHEQGSRLSRTVLLADVGGDGGDPPVFEARGTELAGVIEVDRDGRLVYRTDAETVGLHVLGDRRVRWANLTGILALLATLLAVFGHAGARWIAARRRGATPAEHTGPRVYMYSTYERLWHWLQAAAILLLLWTGLEIHAGLPGWLPFELSVRLHNALGFVVVANALLAAFYHLASGDIQQYLPEPRGFYGQAIRQARYYLSGIFRGDPHPFEKTPDRKLNPLQQLTYLGILNVLLPLQMVTGLAMWGAQRWPAVDSVFGGLTFLAPLHALSAWLFGSFLLMHVYLTTTGPTPTANIQAMVAGWEGESAPDAESPA